MAKDQNIKQKQCCNKFNEDFKNGPHQKKKNRINLSQMVPGYHSEKQNSELIRPLIWFNVAFLKFLGNWAGANVLGRLIYDLLIS